MEPYSANEFIEALESEKGLTLPTPPTPPVIQTGLVDPTKSNKEEGIYFAPGTQRSNWTTVPVSIIEKVEHLSNQHDYPYVRLHLKTEELTGEARAIADILQFRPMPGPTTMPSTSRYPTMAPNIVTSPATPSPTGRYPTAPPPIGRCRG